MRDFFFANFVSNVYSFMDNKYHEMTQINAWKVIINSHIFNSLSPILFVPRAWHIGPYISLILVLKKAFIYYVVHFVCCFSRSHHAGNQSRYWSLYIVCLHLRTQLSIWRPLQVLNAVAWIPDRMQVSWENTQLSQHHF